LIFSSENIIINMGDNMAYYYEHLKGFTTTGIKFLLDFNQLQNTETTDIKTPLFSYQGTTDTDSINLGHLVTTKMDNGKIEKEFTFSANSNILMHKIYFDERDNVILNPSATTNTFMEGKSTVFSLTHKQVDSTDPTKIAQTIFTIDSSKVRNIKTQANLVKTYFDTTGKFNVNTTNSTDDSTLKECPISFTIYTNDEYKGFALSKKSAEGKNQIASYFNIPILCDASCNALYFNATSDRRAKTDIVQSTFSALDIVNKLPIYNFKYKSDNSNSIGIIAQEALKVNAGNFDLVINPQASGENGDYMSVKESKLVYIAWKAIQEQQKIIDNQSKEIEELKQLVKTLIQK